MRGAGVALAGPVVALVLGAAVACDATGQNAAPGAAGAGSSAGTPTAPPSGSGQPVPSPTETGEDPYAEAATRFGLGQRQVEDAVVAARLEMLRVGGREGEKLDGGILDPAIVGVFARRLGAPAERARSVVVFLVAEWREYDEKAERERPGDGDKWVRYVAAQLHISPRRAAWIGTLIHQRPANESSDPIFAAVARDLGVTSQRLARVVDGLKGER